MGSLILPTGGAVYIQTLDYRTPAQVFEEGRNQVHQSEVSLTPELVPA